MSERRFTAQEMRKIADNPIYCGNDCEIHLQPEVVPMLRYAARLVERCEKERANYIYSTGCGGLVQNAVTASAVGLIDRIVLGANGEEEK